MSILTWRKSYETGLVEIDNHHKHLIFLLNKSHSLYRSVLPKEDLPLLLSELIEYTIYHFNAEESKMLKHSYDGYKIHKEEHDSFIEKIQIFKDAYKKDYTALTMELFVFLSHWFTSHILESDIQMGKYLGAQENLFKGLLK
jgi:hemerythrin